MATDWDRLRVVELKEECKSRNISITGLKLKQQYIDKLVEYDSTSQDATLAEESVEDRTDGAFEEVEEKESPETAKSSTNLSSDHDADREQNKEYAQASAAEDIPIAVERDSVLHLDRSVAPRIEDSQDATIEPEGDMPMADTVQEARDTKKDDMLIPEPEQVEVSKNSTSDEVVETADQREDSNMAETDTHNLDHVEKEPVPMPIIDEIDTSARDGSTLEDSVRKRKRRSATPTSDSREIQKKAKGEFGDAIITKTLSLSPERKSPGLLKESNGRDGAEYTSDIKQGGEEKFAGTQEQQSRPTPVTEDRMTEPAVHAATRSLYMRNFKRPLNVPSLRSHVLAIAQGASSVPHNEDVIQFWHMNNIRSHAFVTFTNISAASRVRMAMHQTRFPDEPQREPLWIDFVPDDKVEGWVEQETGSSRGQRNSASKYEVVYNDTREGVEAVFGEVGAARGSLSRPGIKPMGTDRSSLSLRQPSYSTDPSKTSTVTPDVHPDRAALVPHEADDRSRSPPPDPTPRKLPHADQGRGFGALDDLFSYTATKPKLYFKKVSQDTIDNRLYLIQDLYSDRGVSGDPGMKRYTFEKQSGREEWVDNGPEFGHGKRGQDRLVGIGGRGRGGYRGRGGRGGGDGRFFGGDSYRGGGRR